MTSASTVASFRKLKILIIGDVMLDKFAEGVVERISPEAPVPILKVTHEKIVPGGSANVANNIKSLGATPLLLGVVGSDKEGEMLISELQKNNILTSGIVYANNRKTTTKTRLIAQNQQMLRVDSEQGTSINGSSAEFELLNSIKSLSAEANAIIISDYSKGTITPNICLAAIKTGKKVIIDPKPANQKSYKGAFLITPNQKEAEEMTGRKADNDASILEIGQLLCNELECNTIITRGEHGMTIFSGTSHMTIPTLAREVFDVTGAGDTAVAAITLAIASGLSLKEAAEIGNAAAGLAVEKAGTAAVTAEELILSLPNLMEQ